MRLIRNLNVCGVASDGVGVGVGSRSNAAIYRMAQNTVYCTSIRTACWSHLHTTASRDHQNIILLHFSRTRRRPKRMLRFQYVICVRPS